MRHAGIWWLVVVVVLLGACSNREPVQARAPVHTGSTMAVAGPDGVQRATIRANERFRFVPSTIDAVPGKLRITVQNTGTTPHDLRVLGASTGLIGGGESAAVTVLLPKPGSYPFVCVEHIRLHMQGTIVVRRRA